MSRNKLAILAALALSLLLPALPAHAQASRTWVSGVGDDANPCSRTAPCKTFAGAISKTAANGEISVLDPGGFGAVTITKSISIIADGSEGSILASGTSGIIINGVGIAVNISGLYLEGFNTGLSAIRILQASRVHIRKCLIRGFQNAGATINAIEVSNSTNVEVYVNDCTLSTNRRGILAKPTGAATAKVVVDNVRIENNNGTGIRAEGAGAEVWMSNSTITGNNTGLSKATGGVIHSFGNNIVINNTTDGTPTDTLNPI